MVAINRHGEFFEKGECVTMIDKPVLYKELVGMVLIIEDIKEVPYGESGFNVLLKEKSTGRIFKKWLDTNWIQKLK